MTCQLYVYLLEGSVELDRAQKRRLCAAEDEEPELNTEGGTSAKKNKNDESGKDK